MRVPYTCPECDREAEFMTIDLASGMTYTCPCGLSREICLIMEPRAEPTVHVFNVELESASCESCGRLLDIGDSMALFGDEGFPVCEDCLLGALRDMTKLNKGGSDDETPV